MDEAYPEPPDLQEPLIRHPRSDRRRIHVAADAEHRHLAECLQNGQINEIPGVEDQFGVLKVLPDDGKKPVIGPAEVRIGDDADLQN